MDDYKEFKTKLLKDPSSFCIDSLLSSKTPTRRREPTTPSSPPTSSTSPLWTASQQCHLKAQHTFPIFSFQPRNTTNTSKFVQLRWRGWGQQYFQIRLAASPLDNILVAEVCRPSLVFPILAGKHRKHTGHKSSYHRFWHNNKMLVIIKSESYTWKGIQIQIQISINIKANGV